MSDAPATGPPSGGGGGSGRSTTAGGNYAEIPIRSPPRVRRRTTGLPRQFPSQVTGEEPMLETRESLRKTRQKRRQDKIGGESKTNTRSQSWLDDIKRDPTVKESDDRWTTLVKLYQQIYKKFNENEDKITLGNHTEILEQEIYGFLKRTGKNRESLKVTQLIQKLKENKQLTNEEEKIYIDFKNNTEEWIKMVLIKVRKRETVEWDKIKKDFRTRSSDDEWTTLVKLTLKYLWNHSFSRSFEHVEILLESRLDDYISDYYPNMDDKRKSSKIHALITTLKINWQLDEQEQEVYDAILSELYEDDEIFERNQTFEVNMFELEEKERTSEWKKIHEGIADVYVKPINDIGQGYITVSLETPLYSSVEDSN